LNYLVIHIDKDFISGTVCDGNGTSVPITQGTENMLWLYFFNNPHQDRVSFGRENRNHYNERKVNYYGNLTEKITDDTETFTIRGIRKPLIELLEYSDLINLIKTSYVKVTKEIIESIPTLITFSLSISDLSKQTMVAYFSKKGFDIKSYTIPLSELTCYSLLSKKKISVANGGSVIFLAATNATLHIMKMVFSDNYFMIDGEIQSFKGKGIDPRKRALVKYVVNELNNATGALSSPDEIEDECVRKEQKAEDWLKKLDAQSSNRPILITESLSIMQSTQLPVLVRKEHMDKDTAHYVNELAAIFDFYKSKHFSGDIAGLFLLGDCFLSSLVNKKFKNYVREDKLFVLGNNDIPEVLASYPKIDFKRYIDQESRIKALAEAEELKQTEQRALEDRLRTEQELLQNKEAIEKQTELNKIESQQKYEKAVELELEGKLEDARFNIEQALLLDKTSKQISIHHANLLDKIRSGNEKNELYKSYLNQADKYKGQNNFEKALEEYEAAGEVIDNAEIVKAIIEIKRLIKESEKQQEKITNLLSQGNSLIAENKFVEAEAKLNEILVLASNNKDANKLLTEIPLLIIKHQEDLKKQELLLQFEQYVQLADNLFIKKKYVGARENFELAASIQKDKRIDEGIKACNAKLKKLDDAFSSLLLQATHFENMGDFGQAIDFLNQAIELKGENKDLKSKIKKLKFDIQFRTLSISNEPNVIPNKVTPTKPKNDKLNNNSDERDFFTFANKKVKIRKTSNKELEKEDDFLINKPKSVVEKHEDGIDLTIISNHKNGTNTKNDSEDDFLNNDNISKKEDDFLFVKKKVKLIPPK
jgi:tetratricopeptide (TPR) repeat protein